MDRLEVATRILVAILNNPDEYDIHFSFNPDLDHHPNKAVADLLEDLYMELGRKSDLFPDVNPPEKS